MHPRSALLLAGVVLLGPSFSAFAQTWDGGGANGNWSTAANWNPNVAPNSGPNTVLIFDGTLRLASTQNITGAFQLHALTFASNAGAFVLGGNALDFRNGTATLEQNSASAITINSDLLLTASLRVSGTGTGSLALPKTLTGAGTLILAGASVAGNTLQISLGGENALPGGVYLGDNTLPGGVDVTVNSDRAFGTGPLLIHAGNTLRAAGGARVVPAQLTLSFGGNAALPDRLTIASGSNLTFNGGADFLSAENTLEINNTLTTLQGPLSGSGLVHKTGAGVLALGGDATSNASFFAVLAAEAGTVRVLTSTALANSGVLLGAGALDFAGLTNLSLGGLGGSANFTLPTGTFTLGRNQAGTFTYSGTLSGTGRLLKAGSNAQELHGSGGGQMASLQVQQGTLSLGNAGNFTISTTSADGALVGSSTTSGALSVVGGATLDTRSSPSTAVLRGTLTVTGSNSRLLAGTQLVIGRSDAGAGATAQLEAMAGGRVETGTLVVGGNAASGTAGFSSGSLNATNVTLGATSGSVGTASLLANSDWTVANNLSLGGQAGATGGTGSLTIGAGSSVQAGGSIELYSSGSALTIAQGSVTAAALQTFNGANPLTTLTNSAGGYALTVGGSDLNMTYDGRFAGSGTLRKIGTGALTLTNPNSTGGRIRMEGGPLVLGHPLAFQGLVIEVISDDPFNLQTHPNAVLGGLSGIGQFNINNVNLTVGAASTDETFSGQLVGNGTLTKVGTGRLILAGSNSFRGQITIERGTLELANLQAVVSDARVRLGPGTLALRVPVISLGALESTTNTGGTGTIPGGLVTRAAGAPAAVTLLVEVPSGATQVYAGGTADGPGGKLALSKLGPGTLRLGSQGVAHTGLTTVDAGVLELDGSLTGANGSSLPGGLRLTGGSLRLASGPGLAGIYIAGQVPLMGHFAPLANLNAYFGSTPPSLLANNTTTAPFFNFGGNVGGNPNNFPAPYNLAQSDNLQVRWSGRYYAGSAGAHRFELTSDDGSVLYVNGQLVVDNNFSQAPTTRDGTIQLSAGWHDLTIGYYQGGGGYFFTAAVQYPGLPGAALLDSSWLGYTTRAFVGGLSGAGAVQLGSGHLVLGGAGTYVYTGSISDTGTYGAGDVTISGPGSQILRGAGNWTGGLSLQGGTLGVGHGSALGSGTLRVTGAAQIFADGADRSLANAVQVEAGGTLTLIDDSVPRQLQFVNEVSGNGVLAVDGAGELSLANAGGFTGQLLVNTGLLTLNGTVPASAVTVSGGVLQLNGADLSDTSGSVVLLPGGTLRGSGLVRGPVLNFGDIDVSGPQTLTLTGQVLNDGLLRASHGAILDASAAASFTNYGLIDIISGTFRPPADFVNLGVILDASVVQVRSTTRSGGTVTVTIDSHTGHTYRLQRRTSLSSGSFADVGAPQTGQTGQVLSFQDQNASGTSGFYRVAVD